MLYEVITRSGAAPDIDGVEAVADNIFSFVERLGRALDKQPKAVFKP